MTTYQVTLYTAGFWTDIGEYTDMARAMDAAKKAAGVGAGLDAHWGPTAVAYRAGAKGTAVVAFRV